MVHACVPATHMSYSIRQLGVQPTLVNQVAHHPDIPTFHCLVETTVHTYIQVKLSVTQLLC